MTSLYDQYHSEKNKTHMYNLIKDLINNNGGTINDTEFKNYYDNKLNEIFIESTEDNLVNLNRELLRHHITYYKQNYNTNAKVNEIISNTKNINEKMTNDNSDIKNQYDEFIKNREFPKERVNPIEPSIKPIIEPSIKPIIEPSIKPIIEPIIEPIIKPIKKITLTSANRKNIQSNRFDYSVICNKEINKFERLIIPIENSIHFSIPILRLIIKELNIDMNIYLKNTHILNNYTYGEYIPDDHKIVKIGELLTIKIQSIYDDSEYNVDIYEGKLNDVELYLEDFDDFKINDIISINSKEFIKIIDIIENTLILENVPLLAETLEDEKIYVMNMNLQNTLVFS